MVSESLKRDFVLDVILLRSGGVSPVIVHGGGPQIGETLKRMGKESTFVQGMRVTDGETMDIVEMVLAGKGNKENVSLIKQNGGNAVGLSGKDGNLIRASKHNRSSSTELTVTLDILDLAMVCKLESVNPQII